MNFTHLRTYLDSSYYPYNLGGITLCYKIIDTSFEKNENPSKMGILTVKLQVAIAICSIEDNFNKKLGRELSSSKIDTDYEIITYQIKSFYDSITKNDTKLLLTEDIRERKIFRKISKSLLRYLD